VSPENLLMSLAAFSCTPSALSWRASSSLAQWQEPHTYSAACVDCVRVHPSSFHWIGTVYRFARRHDFNAIQTLCCRSFMSSAGLPLPSGTIPVAVKDSSGWSSATTPQTRPPQILNCTRPRNLEVPMTDCFRSMKTRRHFIPHLAPSESPTCGCERTDGQRW
jgi:hypothetical protein